MGRRADRGLHPGQAVPGGRQATGTWSATNLGVFFIRDAVGQGLGIAREDVAHLEPLAGRDLTEEDRSRLANLGKNPPRDVEDLTMTHCVPDTRHEVTR